MQRNSKARELEYAVFFRSGDTHYGWRPDGYKMRFSEPGITSIGGLLYMNGDLVDVADGSRLFVYTSSQNLESIDVTEEELKVIEEIGFDRLDETRLWQEKLWPKLQKYEPIPVKDVEK
jgi:hypothetical protein